MKKSVPAAFLSAVYTREEVERDVRGLAGVSLYHEVTAAAYDRVDAARGQRSPKLFP